MKANTYATLKQLIPFITQKESRSNKVVVTCDHNYKAPTAHLAELGLISTILQDYVIQVNNAGGGDLGILWKDEPEVRKGDDGLYFATATYDLVKES